MPPSDDIDVARIFGREAANPLRVDLNSSYCLIARRSRMASLRRSFIASLCVFAFCLGAAKPNLTVAVQSGTTGAESIIISGTAPANAEVLLESSAVISEDLPTLSLGEKSVYADASGHFNAILLLGPVYGRSARVTVWASAGDGRFTASGSTFVRAPNASNPNAAWDSTRGNR